MTREPQEPSSLLSRSMQVLDYVARMERAVTVSEIVESLAVPKPSAHRICATLQRMGLLARDLNPKRLTPGPQLVRIALATLHATAQVAARRAVLRQVVDETHETCSLTIMDADELVFLDRVESANPLRLQLFAGSRVPLHCTSGGKLFLSMLPPARRERIIKARPLQRLTAATFTDPRKLERELEEIRRERVGRDHQEYIHGLVALAVPITDRHGKMVAALSVNGPATRVDIDRNRARYLVPLMRAADTLRAMYGEDAESPPEIKESVQPRFSPDKSRKRNTHAKRVTARLATSRRR